MSADPVPSRVERLSVAQRSALALLTLYKILLVAAVHRLLSVPPLLLGLRA